MVVEEVVGTRSAFGLIGQNRVDLVLWNRIEAKRGPRSRQHAVLADIDERGKGKLLHVPTIDLAPEANVHDHGGELAIEFLLPPVGIDTLPEVTQ